MTQLLSLPWLELAIVLPFLCSLLLIRMRDRRRAWKWGLWILSTTLLATVFGVGSLANPPSDGNPSWNPQLALFGQTMFRLDNLNAPLLPTVALLYLLTVLATSGTKLQRFSVLWALISLSLQLATLSCVDPWTLVLLMIVGIVPPLAVLHGRGKSKRVYLLHMGLFAGLLSCGWYFMEQSSENSESFSWAIVAILLGLLVRCGVFPVHCWLTDLFESSSFGNALLAIAPLTGVYAIVRLVLPIAPEWVLQSIGVISLFTAIYAAGMATIQKEARRFFAFVFLSHASLVLVGMELATPTSLTGSLHLWLSFILSLGGFGLTLRALEARVGRLSLTRFHGLYNHSPDLAICFLLTGLASVGFPGTVGFVAAEVLVEGAIMANPWVGVGIIAVAALNGIAMMRAYFLLFMGTRHPATIPLGITMRERVAFLTLAALLIGAGLIPQPLVASRHRAAEEIWHGRESHMNRVQPIQATPGQGKYE